MKVQTGQGTIPLITLVGIFSISALNALPGLAVSPILGDLNKIFPSATDLEIQMLSSLPSLLIIPFILLSGKLTEKVNNLLLLQIGLALFGASGILYLLSDKMWQLIAVSAMLGMARLNAGKARWVRPSQVRRLVWTPRTETVSPRPAVGSQPSTTAKSRISIMPFQKLGSE